MSEINLKLKSYDELIFEITKLNTDNYLLKQKLENIKFYIEQSDIKDMLWGKEILKIIGGNDDSKRNV